MNEIEISNWDVFLRNSSINFAIFKFQAIIVVEVHPSHSIKIKLNCGVTQFRTKFQILPNSSLIS